VVRVADLGAIGRIALLVLAGWLTVVWFCGAVYIAVSYVVAQRWLPERSLGQVVRAVLRECWVVAWTQPM